MRIASFDIGKLNLCFYIEDFNEKNITKSNCVNSGEIILWKNNNITKNCFSSTYLDTELYHNLTELLREYKSYWDDCDLFLIEQQMSFGSKKINTMALKLGQHCYSFFEFTYGRSKQIIDYPAYHKTQILEAPKKLTKPQRKLWCVNKTTQILTQRGITTSPFHDAKKKDDLADTLCMLQAYKLGLLIGKKKKIDVKYSLEYLSTLKVCELKELCKKNKYRQVGKKQELIERLKT